MRIPLLLFATAFLSSCVHTALSPVSSPEGVPVVVRVPGTRAGQKVDRSRIAAIDKKVEQEIAGKTAPGGKPDPRIIGIGTIGIYGDVKTKKGESFVGYAPSVVVRSTYPAEAVDRAAGLAAAAYYRAAKKHYTLIPVTDLAEKPRPKKP